MVPIRITFPSPFGVRIYKSGIVFTWETNKNKFPSPFGVRIYK